jgi:hypothetical protein
MQIETQMQTRPHDPVITTLPLKKQKQRDIVHWACPLRLTRSFRTERRVTTIRTVPRRGVCATAKLARAVLAHAGVSHHGVAGAGPLRKARGPPPASLGREASWSLANET